MPEPYHDPVTQLLTLGDVRGKIEWDDYAALGLTAEHLPELAQMVVDDDLHWADSEGDEVWAPVHAWRALGQLRAESAIEPLLQLLDRIDDDGDDWVQTDLPQVFGMIGPAVIPGLRDFIADAEHGEWARITAGEGLVKIVKQFPESRDQVIAILTERLRQFDEERVINAYLVNDLCDLKAAESAPVIEQAFAADVVDLSVLGDWEEAQILLGLLKERETPAPNFFELEFGPLAYFGPRGRETVQPAKLHSQPKIGRNEPCPCGSGRKYKRCCGKKR
jgi:HEAT repeat protein